jgi:hypothetical protein
VKTRIIFYFLVVAACGACSNNSRTASPESSADSAKKANKVYTSKLLDLTGNRNMEQLLCQGWELEDDLDVVHSSDESMGMLPFRSYYLSVDSSFVKNPRSAMEYGTWRYDKDQKKITFHYSKGEKDVYKIAAMAADELVLVNTGVESETQLKFVSAGKRYKDIQDDPFHISNNQWRLHPKKPESEEQIRKRLKDYLHFNILFYRDNLAKEAKEISFYGLPTCLKWYAGGIYMVKEPDLNANWFYCFYNKDQAMKAYKMMGDLLTKKYNWPKGNVSWVNKNLSVLEQMYERL